MEDDYETVVTKVLHHINRTKHLLHRFKCEVQNKNVIVCLGNTRSGKSTVVNYIQGNELEAFEDTKRTYIKVKETIRTGPTISHGSVSFTEFPSVWEIQSDMNTILIDVPGFEDNRGVTHDVVNTLFFNKLKHARSVKLVLISDINDIDSDNVQAFTSAIAKVQNVIDDFNELKDAVSVIFTKDCRNYKKEDMVKLLKDKILDVAELQVKKDLIYQLIKNVNNIGILRMPLRAGRVMKDEVDHNIEDAIFNTHPIILNANNIKFTPSKQTHNTLLDIYQKYVTEMDFDVEVKKSVRQFDSYFKVEKYVFASTEEELDYTKTQLLYILTRITTEKAKDLPTTAALKESLSNISGQLSQGCRHKLNFMKHMDDWSLMDDKIKQVMIRTYKKALTNIEDQINKLIDKIDAEVKDRTDETVQYIISELASDRNKLILTSASFIPLAKKTLTMLGVTLPEGFTFEVIELGASGWGLAGAGAVGLAVGGYAVLYYKTIRLRKNLRKEQGR